MILSATTYVRKPPDSATAFAPRWSDAVSPPSVCASGTTTSSAARPRSTTSPSSDSSYSPSETFSCATDTGMTATPVTVSAALVNGSRSTPVTAPSSPSASWRVRIDAASFLRGSLGGTAAFSQAIRSAPMAATLIDGKALAAKVRAEVAADVAELGHVGLATILVGEDPASEIYIRGKHKAAREAGFESFDHHLPTDTSEEALLALIAEINADDAVDGLLVQLPVPDHLDENTVIEAISPAKDIDGLHPMNAGRLALGRPGLVPGTPMGIMRMLEEYEIETKGAEAVVVGRSNIVGKPMAQLLLRSHATVTICHSRTRDLRPAHPRGRHPRGRRRKAARDRGGHGQAGRDRDRRRHEPHGRRAVRRRRPGGGRARRVHHARPGRGRPDDDRHGPEEHRRRGTCPARDCCETGFLS